MSDHYLINRSNCTAQSTHTRLTKVEVLTGNQKEMQDTVRRLGRASDAAGHPCSWHRGAKSGAHLAALVCNLG